MNDSRTWDYSSQEKNINFSNNFRKTKLCWRWTFNLFSLWPKTSFLTFYLLISKKTLFVFFLLLWIIQCFFFFLVLIRFWFIRTTLLIHEPKGEQFGMISADLHWAQSWVSGQLVSRLGQTGLLFPRPVILWEICLGFLMVVA